MVSVGYIQVRYSCKYIRYLLYILLIFYYPEMMSYTVCCFKVIFGRYCICYYLIQVFIVRVGKKYWFYIRIIHTYMLHAVFFLISACEFVLFYLSIHVIIYMRAYYQPILSFSIHGLRIYIVVLFSILLQPTLFLKLVEILYCTLIYIGVMFVDCFFKIYLRLYDAVKRFFVSFCFESSFQRA